MMRCLLALSISVAASGIGEVPVFVKIASTNASVHQNPTHYGPADGCLADEGSIQVASYGVVCAPNKVKSQSGCPTDTPKGATAAPFYLDTPAVKNACTLKCSKDSECGSGSHCQTN